jgi:hypothetical protein
MGVRFPSVQTNTFVGPLPASAVETVVLTTPPLTLPLDGAVVILLWMAMIAGGATTTDLDFRLRRGTTSAGVQVGATSWNLTAVVGSGRALGGWYFDTPGAVAGIQYSLTVAQVGATGAGTFNDGALLAFAL